MTEKHAFFAPSGAPVWAHCSAFPVIDSTTPGIDTPDTLEGNAAHWVVSEVLVAAGRHAGLDVDAVLAMRVGLAAPNGTVIDEDITDSARVMVEDVLGTCRQYGARPADLLIEFRVHAPAIHPTKCWGTLDVCLDLRRCPQPRVILWDYKHGHGRVDAKGNFQLTTYAEGLRNEWSLNGKDDTAIALEFRIIQPRCYQRDGPGDTHAMLFSDIRADVNRLAAKAHEAENNPQMSAGLHCRYCPGVIRCEASRNFNYHLIDRTQVPLRLDNMTGADLAVERQILTDGGVTLKSRLEDIEEELRSRVSGGDASTGLALETNYGRLGWAVPVAEVIAFGGQFGADLSKEEACTPTQAVAKVPKPLRPHFEAAMKSVAKREARGLKLVQADGSRTARAFTNTER